MKSIIYSLSLLLLFSVNLYAQDAHINFEEGDWEMALKKANKENKVIFVDAYTTWCGPCKMMAKSVFTDAAVSEFYNEHFINMKIDMEKGEGILFAKAYDVRAYPTFVFVDANGNVAHKGLGYMKAEKFIELGNVAVDEENRLGSLMMKYDKGDRDPAFLKKYSQALQNAYDDGAADIAAEYLATQEDWSSAENAPYIAEMFSYEPTDELYKYVVKNRNALAEHADLAQIDRKLKAGTARQIHADKMDVDEQRNYFSEVFGNKGEEYFAEYNMRKYSRLADDEMKSKYCEAAVHYLNTYNVTDWQMLNSVAWTFYENVDDVDHLKHALNWAKISVDQDSNYMNNDTLAALYFKLGDKKMALAAAKEAIRIAKEKGQDYEETESLLKKIEAL